MNDHQEVKINEPIEGKKKKKTKCCNFMKQCFVPKAFKNFAVGRNVVAVQAQFLIMGYNFFYGIFDQFSDWYYYFNYKSEKKFASETV